MVPQSSGDGKNPLSKTNTGLDNLNDYVRHKMLQEVSEAMGTVYSLPYRFTLMVSLQSVLFLMDASATVVRVNDGMLPIYFILCCAGCVFLGWPA